MNYRITQINSWIVVNTSGKAENNEPLRVKYLFNKWLTREGIRVIINLKELAHFGIWEVGLLASMPIPQKRADLRTWSYQRRSGAKRRA